MQSKPNADLVVMPPKEHPDCKRGGDEGEEGEEKEKVKGKKEIGEGVMNNLFCFLFF